MNSTNISAESTATALTPPTPAKLSAELSADSTPTIVSPTEIIAESPATAPTVMEPVTQDTHPGFSVRQPPDIAPLTGGSVFLAGSIKMGKAPEWQKDVTERLSSLPITILNPHRDHWNANLEQDISNPEFRGQVRWELGHQEKATMIAMYLHPETISPISLIELGLFIKTGKMVICCPDGFHMRGNVQVMCDEYGGKLVKTLDELVEEVKDRIKCWEGSSDKNTVRQHIRLFNRLLSDANRAKFRGSAAGVPPHI